MAFDTQTISAVALGISLSACCGFRIFVPMLAASIAAINHWIHLPADMLWLGSWPAFTAFSVAALVEIAAYYIPFLDNLLDTIATPIAILAGTLLATALLPLPGDTGLSRWVFGFLAGGTTAGTIQVGSGMLRLFSTKATLATGNPLLATGENAAAVTGSLLAFVVPVVVALILLTVIGYALYSGYRRLGFKW